MASVLNNKQRMFIVKVRANDKIVSTYIKPGINFISDEEAELIKDHNTIKNNEIEIVMSAVKSKEQEETVVDVKPRVEEAVKKKTKKAK